ncbi:hypothetical protein [Streptomyces hydrogenans]
MGEVQHDGLGAGGDLVRQGTVLRAVAAGPEKLAKDLSRPASALFLMEGR